MARENKSAKIFFVEDDPDLAEMLTAYFQMQGYQVAKADLGEEAVNLIGEFMPDIAVLDIRLPDIDGYEVCRRLRNNRRTQELPIIFLTEKRDRTDKLSGLELGAVDYITKPFDIQELRLRVRNALRRSNRSSGLNPVTGLPEGEVMRERLTQALQKPDWGLVLVRLLGLHKFRDRYGFVAADDVSRAVALMLINATQETGDADDFVGHLDVSDYMLVTSARECKKLARRCDMRLQASLAYFYPALDRHLVKDLDAEERLQVRVATLSAHEHQFNDLDKLFGALLSVA